MAPQTDVFNDDELDAPQWMDIDFFTKVLHHSEKNKQIKVKSFHITPATVKGDHYASVMFRAKVQYHLNKIYLEKSLIIKTMPNEDSEKSEMLQGTKIFETEISMYAEVIPRFEKILRGIGENTVLGANCIYHSLSPNKVIIFEDLASHGYEVLRDRPITKEELLWAYTKLAKWHAISYKILHEDPKFFESYRHGIFTLPQFTEKPSFTKGIEFFLEFIEKEPLLTEYKKYFIPYRDTIVEKCKESFQSYYSKRYSDREFVLCHGDFHVKNIMVKINKQTGKLEDLMPLDFQLCYVGPMHNDLVYSFYMMIGEDLRSSSMDELLYEYHTVFKNTLKKLNFKEHIPSLVQLRDQMLRDQHVEMFLITSFFPLWLKFKKGEVDVEEINKSADYQRTFYDNPVYKEELKKLLPRYLHRGYLENLINN